MPVLVSPMGNPMLRCETPPMAYSRSMRPTLTPAVRPPVLPRFPLGTPIGGSPIPATTPPSMPPVPNSTTPRIASTPSPSLNDENPSIGGTRLGAQTQSSSRANWCLQEAMVLVEAKKDLDVRQEGGIYIRSFDRWHMIAEACWSRGVHRSKSQCKTKWERLHTLFTRVCDYECKIPYGCNSYWQMDVIEWRTRGLPTEDFPFEVYDKMENLFGGRRNVDVAGLLYDSLDDDTVPMSDGPENVQVEQPSAASEPQTPPPQGAPVPGASSDTTADA
ncbi:hypothetical protein GOP47_0003860 [Adiantum capillus-veneris]|uniref:Myb-like domain-containing protein n=1 Tax=Adiantum capillus-veneris TaxID=13818 RepID=A0A9D4ZNZ0_ADICA|nr:hypothetical protein GOP47_0003860 [Adiantum capillus-veneris]